MTEPYAFISAEFSILSVAILGAREISSLFMCDGQSDPDLTGSERRGGQAFVDGNEFLPFIIPGIKAA